MNAKTHELLYVLLWCADQLFNPTLRNLTDSFEAWAYRKGLLRQLAALEKKALVQRHSASTKDRVYRLTEQGRICALGGRDPAARWSRPWDGRWRLVLFDLPAAQQTERERLWRYLRGRFFGYLQQSVWISPDPLQEERERLGGGTINVESLILLEGRPCAGESDEAIVRGAWDFEDINRRYAHYLKMLNAPRPRGIRCCRAACYHRVTWGYAPGNAGRRRLAPAEQPWATRPAGAQFLVISVT